MVKILSSFALCLILISNSYSSIVLEKAQIFVGEDEYIKHKRLIHSIFQDEHRFIKDKEQVNSLLIIKELRKYGLFNLFKGGKRDFEININAKVHNNLLFFIKNIKESFLDLGFNYIFVKNIKYVKQNLNLKLKLTSEAVINPITLNNELLKRGINILDIDKQSNTIWNYHLSSSKLRLSQAMNIREGSRMNIKKIINDIHLKVNDSKIIDIKSDKKNKWHPYVVFFDDTLNPIQIIEKDSVMNEIQLFIPDNTKYIKITDKYVIKNIKHGISVLLTKG